jgi:hypothetical protein
MRAYCNSLQLQWSAIQAVHASSASCCGLHAATLSAVGDRLFVSKHVTTFAQIDAEQDAAGWVGAKELEHEASIAAHELAGKLQAQLNFYSNVATAFTTA